MRTEAFNLLKFKLQVQHLFNPSGGVPRRLGWLKKQIFVLHEKKVFPA
jgi:hypothetical protein